MEWREKNLTGHLNAQYASNDEELLGLKTGEYGILTDIQRFCVHDGPGIRTLVFFKGCPMRCVWCQNPESNRIQRELMHREERCIRCGYCVRSCDKHAVEIRDGKVRIDRAKCSLCGNCVETCYAGSMEIVGKLYSVQQVVDAVVRDEAFYRQSNGGVTLSGGEVTLQYRFAQRILRELKNRKIGTAIETAGYCGWEALESLLPLTDLFLYDVKHMDAQAHEAYTGVSNQRIQQNLHRLAENGARIIIRVPLIPGVNDSVEHLTRVVRLAECVNAAELHILPFHQAGKSKWSALDRDYSCGEWGVHSQERLEQLHSAVSQSSVRINIGGSGSAEL